MKKINVNEPRDYSKDKRVTKYHIPEGIFEIEGETDFFNIGSNISITLTEDFIVSTQKEYRTDEETWVGKEYCIVGIDFDFGDLILIKLDEPKLPVYLMHDDYENIIKIANSFSQYIETMQFVISLNLEKAEERKKALNCVRKYFTKDGYEDFKDALEIEFDDDEDLDC